MIEEGRPLTDKLPWRGKRGTGCDKGTLRWSPIKSDPQC